MISFILLHTGYILDDTFDFSLFLTAKWLTVIFVVEHVFSYYHMRDIRWSDLKHSKLHL